jgi:uncharacterized protein (DUF58 family)
MDFRRLEWYARQLSLPLAGGSGETVSASGAILRGRGLTFAGLREYEYGDDVRAIDWNATARFARPFVKTFHEDRTFDLLILVDCSASLGHPASLQSKGSVARELAALFVFVALRQDEQVGVLLFSDRTEWKRPLGRGRGHANVLLRAISKTETASYRTDLSRALKEINRLLPQPGFVLLISDFIADDYEEDLRAVSRRHDVFALALIDPRDVEPPNVGLVQVRDVESGRFSWIDTNSTRARNELRATWLIKQAERREVFRRSRIASVDIFANQPYFATLRNACRRYRLGGRN